MCQGEAFSNSLPSKASLATFSFFCFSFVFYEWEQNGYNVPFLESASLMRKRKRKPMKRIKRFYKISKKGNRRKNKSCHLVPKVVTDLPFEGRKPEIQKEGESSPGGK